MSGYIGVNAEGTSQHYHFNNCFTNPIAHSLGGFDSGRMCMQLQYVQRCCTLRGSAVAVDTHPPASPGCDMRMARAQFADV
jgi:hypothetical protein